MNTQLLNDLDLRMKAYSEGVLSLLKLRGLDTDEPTLEDLYNASLIDPMVIDEVVTLCYPNEGVANAWTDIIAGVGRGLSAAFGKEDKGSSDATTQMMLMQQQQAAEDARRRQTTMLYVGIGVAVLVVGIIIFSILKNSNGRKYSNSPQTYI